MIKQEIKKNKYLIVDTCIIQYSNSSNKAQSETILKCLKELVNQEYRLAISEFTIYENLNGLSGKKAEQAKNILKNYEWKVISSDVLVLSSILGGLYHEEKCEGPNSGDHIIAATTILEDGLLLTSNHRDFPHPFFLTEKSLPIRFEYQHYFITRDLSVYKPNIPLLIRRIDEKQLL